MLITIDGPAGSGKSTVARTLAARLGVAYLDTGAMYRALTLAALEKGVELQSESALAQLARQTRIELKTEHDPVRVLLDGRDVSRQIRSARVSDQTHHLAGLPGVRAVLVAAQRDMGRKLGSLVSEGRDQGTVVFPDADVKFYLDAAPEKRAQRRWADLQADGEQLTHEEVLASLQARDGADHNRAVAPLRCPDDAIALDTTDMSIEQVVEQLLAHVRKKKGTGKFGQGIGRWQKRLLPRFSWYRFCRCLVRVVALVLFRTRVDGLANLPARGGALIVSNHQSFMDPIFVGHAMQRDLHYMARDTLFRNRWFGRLLRSLHVFPVKRASADVGAIRETLRRLRQGCMVLVFPEGTRTGDGRIAPLHAGVILIARRAGVPIVPVVIDGAFEAWPRNHRWPTLFARVRVRFGRPLPAERIAGTDGRKLVDHLQSKLLHLQEQLHALR